MLAGLINDLKVALSKIFLGIPLCILNPKSINSKNRGGSNDTVSNKVFLFHDMHNLLILVTACNLMKNLKKQLENLKSFVF